MIIPKRDAKYYGAVHIDNYLTFTGFCKKVDSEEICDVDVFVDGKKIDTLKADKKIRKVEDIYDIENHGFLFELEEKYFEKSHLLEFKASSGEELVNSKIQTIDKNHPKFNEYQFFYTLSKSIDKNQISNNTYHNGIGFLAIESELNDCNFVEHIKYILENLPMIDFYVFYFRVEQCSKLQEIFKDQYKRFILTKVNNVFDIVHKVGYFTFSWDSSKLLLNPIREWIIKNVPNINVIPYGKVAKEIIFQDRDKLMYEECYKLNVFKKLLIGQDELLESKNSYFNLFYKLQLEKMGIKNINVSSFKYLYDFEMFLLFTTLSNVEFRKYYLDLNYKIENEK